MDKVAVEVAEAEFSRFIDAMDLDFDESKMGDADRKDFQAEKDIVITAIRRGSLAINDNGEPEYTTRRGEPQTITFHEPTGATLMAMDRKKSSQDVGKMFASMADMTKTSASTFAKMKNADLKVCMAVFTLFLA